jgi:DNA-binding response OmpR family regulator
MWAIRWSTWRAWRFDLLYTLLVNAGRVMTRERLLEQVWGYDFTGDTRAVDSAIKRLRASRRAAGLQANGEANGDAVGIADGIEAVRGLGYKFKR